ncbi:MAG: carbon storage regulator [Clostridiales bacterium]|nr:carbon storage regulator [Clostridiales bacterium]
MLKITIKPGDSIAIDRAKVKVTQSTYNRIQLEIDAPPEIAIRREKAESPAPRVVVVKGEKKM